MGVEVNVDVTVAQAKYRELYVLLRKNFDVVLIELRRLRKSNHSLKGAIDTIEKYLVELDGLIEFPNSSPSTHKSKSSSQSSCPPKIRNPSERSLSLQPSSRDSSVRSDSSRRTIPQ